MTEPPHDWVDLNEVEFPEKSFVIDPWMEQGSLCMIHSWRGIGKTFFSLGLSQAVATNSPFLKWSTNIENVLYFDCEMGRQALTERFAMINRAAMFRLQRNGVRLFTFENMGGVTWNLADRDCQKMMDDIIGDTKLLVIDNLSAACKPSGREDFRTAYGKLRDWLISLKERRISVLIVHHSGKEGKQRGISDIEDPLDIVIQLRRPDNWKITDGTVFEFHFEKTRCLSPKDPSVLEPIQIEIRPKGDDDIEWFYSTVADEEEKRRAKKEESLKEFRGKKDDDRSVFF